MYIIFSYNAYYPCGGADDIHAITQNYEEALELSKEAKTHYEVVEILDTETLKLTRNEKQKEIKYGYKIFQKSK